MTNSITSLSTASRETMPAAKVLQDDLKRPLPKVEVFDHASVTPDQIVAALIEAGGCVVKNAVSTADLALIQNDVQPYLDADKPWEGDFSLVKHAESMDSPRSLKYSWKRSSAMSPTKPSARNCSPALQRTISARSSRSAPANPSSTIPSSSQSARAPPSASAP